MNTKSPTERTGVKRRRTEKEKQEIIERTIHTGQIGLNKREALITHKDIIYIYISADAG